MQYVVAGTDYARCKVKGKPVRAVLETRAYLQIAAAGDYERSAGL
jgi:hypothetical protein